MKKVLIYIFSILLVLLFSYSAKAERDPLLETLIEKGIISEEEAIKIESKEKSLIMVDQSKGLYTLKGENFEIGGTLWLDYVDAQYDKTSAGETDKSNSYFKLNKFCLKPKITLADNIVLASQLDFRESGTNLNEAHLTFSRLPLNTFVKVGLEDRFIKPSPAKVVFFPLIGTAFWYNDDVGIQLGGGYQSLYWRLSVTNGLKLGSYKTARDNSFKIINDARNTSESNYNKEVGVGLGIKHNLGDTAKIDLLGFYYSGELSDDDKNFLQGIPGYGTSEDDTKNFGGARATLDIRNFTLIGEYITAKDGEMDRDGWYVQPSYTFRVKDWKYFNSFKFAVQYGELNVDLPNDPISSLTWDRKKTTFALCIDIHKI